MQSRGDGAGLGSPSITHLWRQMNDALLRVHGVERKEYLQRVESATKDFIVRYKNDHLIDCKDLDSAQELLIECARYLDEKLYPSLSSPAALEDKSI